LKVILCNNLQGITFHLFAGFAELQSWQFLEDVLSPSILEFADELEKTLRKRFHKSLQREDAAKPGDSSLKLQML
jgi:hypothetical protein